MKFLICCLISLKLSLITVFLNAYIDIFYTENVLKFIMATIIVMLINGGLILGIIGDVKEILMGGKK